MEGTMTPDVNLKFCLAHALSDRPPTRLRLRAIPTLIGVVAVFNIASVVMALIE